MIACYTVSRLLLSLVGSFIVYTKAYILSSEHK